MKGIVKLKFFEILVVLKMRDSNTYTEISFGKKEIDMEQLMLRGQIHRLTQALEKQASKGFEKCDNCGAALKNNFAGECKHKSFWSGLCRYDLLCKKCGKTCSKCKKVYCPKHIKNHVC